MRETTIAVEDLKEMEEEIAALQARVKELERERDDFRLRAVKAEEERDSQARMHAACSEDAEHYKQLWERDNAGECRAKMEVERLKAELDSLREIKHGAR